jgi:hypothetical protein
MRKREELRQQLLDSEYMRDFIFLEVLLDIRELLKKKGNI